MKISYVLIENFKGVERFEHSFLDPLTGQVRPITALFGDNGSGKTTVLQAIALVVSLATRRTESLAEFEWFGFLPDRIDTLGETYIKMDLLLDDTEIDAVQEIYEIWKKTSPNMSEIHVLLVPLRKSVVTLEYKGGQLKVLSEPGTESELLGRYLSGKLHDFTGRYQPFLERLGDIFWFDQYRNLANRTFIDFEKEDRSHRKTGVEGLREYLLLAWLAYQNSPDAMTKDFIDRLEKGLSSVFPGATFEGILKKKAAGVAPKLSDFYFLINRAGKKYDISEMSSGEQAVFSVLFDFVSQGISRSIILIDELELHLHPPEQQALYNSLTKIGDNCQFIFTSHSSYLRDIIPEGYKVRLEGGRLCL